jgi:hypothetical protein
MNIHQRRTCIIVCSMLAFFVLSQAHNLQAEPPMQSGHSPVSTNFVATEKDYAMTPTKPCLDGEPAYEYPPDAMPANRSVVAGQASGIGRVQATRDGGPGQNDATYAMVYVPDYRFLIINTQRIASDEIRAYWFDPCSGTTQDLCVIKNQSTLGFETPQRDSGSDWVLVLDAVSADYPKP